MDKILIIVAIVVAAFLFWTLILALYVRCSKNNELEFCSSIGKVSSGGDGIKELLGSNLTTPCVMSPVGSQVSPFRDGGKPVDGSVTGLEDLEGGFIGPAGNIPSIGMAMGTPRQPRKMRSNTQWGRGSNPVSPATSGSTFNLSNYGHQDALRYYNSGLAIFTLQELKHATARFTQRIGVGGFGPVYKGILRDGQSVAVKFRGVSSRQGLPEFHKEVEVLSMLRHKHLVRLIGYCCEKDHEALVYEFISNGTLKEHLFGTNFNKQPLAWRTRLKIVLGVARGIDYLHNHVKPCIIHRDIKPANILLDNVYEAKVADFGLSRLLERDDSTHVTTDIKGTQGYVDPEYDKTKRLTEKSDVYSFGVVLIELLSGKRAYLPVNTATNFRLVDWGLSLIASGSLRTLLDPRIPEGSYCLEAVKMIAKLAMQCCHQGSAKRPLMMKVLRVVHDAYERELASESRLERLPSTKETDGEEDSQEEGVATTTTVTNASDVGGDATGSGEAGDWEGSSPRPNASEDGTQENLKEGGNESEGAAGELSSVVVSEAGLERGSEHGSELELAQATPTTSMTMSNGVASSSVSVPPGLKPVSVEGR